MQALLGLASWLSEDRAWVCDLSSGVLRGEVLLDERLVSVNVSSLAGQQEYAGMLDARLSSSDGLLFLMAEGFDQHTAEQLYEQIRLVKDGQVFSMVIALIGEEKSTASEQKAREWAEQHCGVTVVRLLDEEDSASLAQCVCDVAVNVHRAKAPLLAVYQDQSDFSGHPSPRSGSLRSSRSGSSSSSLNCTGLKRPRRSVSSRRKSGTSVSTTSSLSSKLSKEERTSIKSSRPARAQCLIM